LPTTSTGRRLALRIWMRRPGTGPVLCRDVFHDCVPPDPGGEELTPAIGAAAGLALEQVRPAPAQV
jgi:hypothetical protein